MKFPEIELAVEHKERYRQDIAARGLTVRNEVTVCIVTDGDGMVQILNRPTECHKGDLYFFGSGIAYGFFAKSEKNSPKVSTVVFAPDDILTDDFANPDSAQFCYGVFRDRQPISYALLNSKALAQVEGYCQGILEELENKQLGWESAVRCNLNMLIITLGRYIDLADTLDQPSTKEWQLVSSVMKEVFEHFGDPDMTLGTIADSLYVSKSHLSRMFQRIMGESFATYVRNMRLNKSCELLKYTGLTNEEIVRACGLKDVPSFYRFFKNEMGMTPYQYRMSQSAYDKSRKGVNFMSILNEISETLQKGKSKMVKELVEKAIADGVPTAQILNEGLLSGMSVIGEKFKNNEVYVPEVLVAARAMNAGMQILKPLLKDDGVEATGKVCIGTVQGDLHDIGKNLVKMMMEGKGLEVVDLGVDVAPETFVNAAIEQNCQAICCSALLTTTMDVMADVVKAAEAAGIRDKVKILIGGAPITQEFCDKIGADCYTSDAASAADAAVELCRA